VAVTNRATEKRRPRIDAMLSHRSGEFKPQDDAAAAQG
jgi:hypothetical protein